MNVRHYLLTFVRMFLQKTMSQTRNLIGIPCYSRSLSRKAENTGEYSFIPGIGCVTTLKKYFYIPGVGPLRVSIFKKGELSDKIDLNFQIRWYLDSSKNGSRIAVTTDEIEDIKDPSSYKFQNALRKGGNYYFDRIDNCLVGQ